MGHGDLPRGPRSRRRTSPRRRVRLVPARRRSVQHVARRHRDQPHRSWRVGVGARQQRSTRGARALRTDAARDRRRVRRDGRSSRLGRPASRSGSARSVGIREGVGVGASRRASRGRRSNPVLHQRRWRCTRARRIRYRYGVARRDPTSVGVRPGRGRRRVVRWCGRDVGPGRARRSRARSTNRAAGARSHVGNGHRSRSRAGRRARDRGDRYTEGSAPTGSLVAAPWRSPTRTRS